MAQQNGKWYESRKLWIVGIGLSLITAVALGGAALNMSESMIQSIVAAIVGLVTVLTGAHAYTDVRLGGQEKHNELSKAKGVISANVLNTAMTQLASILESVSTKQGPVQALDTVLYRANPDLIDTPKGKALRLSPSEVPRVLDGDTHKSYTDRVCKFFSAWCAYVIVDPEDGPQRVFNPLSGKVPDDATPDALYAQLLTVVINGPVYVVPGAEATDE